MAGILLITPAEDNPLPALDFLGHQISRVDFDPAKLAAAPRHDLTFLDCRHNLSGAKSVAKILEAAGWQTPLVLVIGEGSLAAINQDWGLTDFLLEGASIGEVDTRIRLALSAQRQQQSGGVDTGLSIDESSFTAKINGRTLDLTFKEFELLRHLNDNPNRVFSREQLLSEVWGYDYFGGTRTVDVHVRRLRAKLGEHESLIGTVRNVGYRLDAQGNANE
jgi:DNA-binding response OmpR family regulator